MARADVFVRESSTGTDAYKAIQARVKSSIKWRAERRIGDKMWRRAQDLTVGKHWSDRDETAFLSSDAPRDRITVNRTLSMIQDYIPFLVNRDPEYTLHPRPKRDTPDEIQLAYEKGKIASWLMNYFWREYGFQDAYLKTIEDGIVLGYGVCKTGWTLVLNEAENPTKEGNIEMDTKVEIDRPFARRISPFRFYFDPLAPDCTLRTARWASEVILMPLQDVVANRDFSTTVRSAIRNGKETPAMYGNLLMEQGVEDEGMKALLDREEKSEALVVLHEHWDKKFEKYYVFADGVEKPLIEESANKFPYLEEFFPYLDYRFVQLNDEPLGLGIPAIIEDQQLELNRVRTSEFQHRRKFALQKFGIASGQLSAESREKLLSDRDEVFDVDGPPNDVIAPFMPPKISSDNYQVDAIINEDMRELLGMDKLMAGGDLPSRTSAREVQARESLMGTKLEGRVQAVDRFALEMGKQLWKHIQANLSADVVGMITGQGGEQIWRTIEPSDITGDFSFELRSSSREKKDPIQERQQRLQLLQILQQSQEAIMAGGQMVDMGAVVKWVLDSFERPETSAFIIEAPPPPPPAEPGQEVPLDTQDQTQRLQSQAGDAVGQGNIGAAMGGGPQLGV